MLSAFLFPLLPLVPCLCALSFGLVLRRLWPVVALECCDGVALLRRVLSCCFALRWCVLCWSLWCGVLPCCGVLCGVAPPPVPPGCCALFCFPGVCWLCCPPPSGWLWCPVLCPVSCGAAVFGVFCVLPGAVWRACFWLGSCPPLWGTELCWVLLCFFCCALLSCAAVFSADFFLRCSLPLRGAPGCFCLCGVLTWCILLFGVALSRCVLVLVPAALCHLLLRCAVVRLLVLCCVVSFVVVLQWRLASSAAVAAVALCLSLGMVMSCPAVLPVVQVLSFLVPCFLAPPVPWRLLCGAVLVCLRRCSLCGALSPLWR